MLSENKEKDMIVVAKNGFSVLLEIGGRTLDIDCYNPVNLSEMFSEEVIKNCDSLRIHLKQENLVRYSGQDLVEDPNSAKVEALKQSAAAKIEASYTQSPDGDRSDMHLKTNAGIDENIKRELQKKINENKTDAQKRAEERSRKFLQKGAAEDNVVDSSTKNRERQHAMSKQELNMKVQMDVDRKDFISKQVARRKALDNTIQNDNLNAEKEIQNVEDSDNSEQND
jgi:hypothetical protein